MAIPSANQNYLISNLSTDGAADPSVYNLVIINWLAQLANNVSGSNAQNVSIKDGVNSSLLATVAQFHNADNQTLASTAYGILTGGVAQLLNSSGSLDRQRETYADVVTNIGIPSGTQQLSWPATVGPVTSGAITGNSSNVQTITVTATSGTTNGVAWALQVGQTLVLQPNTSTQEAFVITAIVGLNVTGLIQKNHAASSTAITFYYDQARSAMIPNGSLGQGISAGGTYLFNSSYNSGSGGWEAERSFSGELMGATGVGAAIAQEYEDSSGGPAAYSTGLPTGFRLFPGVSLLGTGKTSFTVTTSVAGNANLVFASAANTNLLPAGHAIQLSGSGTVETVFTSNTWTPGSSTTVPLQSPVVNSGQTTATWSVYSANGPGLNGFLPHGIGIEEEALYDPVTGLFFIERAATQDGVSAQNVVLEAPGLWNGTTIDRATGSALRGADVTIKPSATAVGLPGTAPANSTSAVTTTVIIKASAGNLYGYSIYNPNASVAYVAFYGVTAPTLGTTQPLWIVPVPATSAVALTFPIPFAGASGISVAAVTSFNGSTAVGTGVNIVPAYV